VKRLWIACAILAALFAATFYNGVYLTGLTDDLNGLLARAEEKAEQEDWDAADALTRLAWQKWQAHDAYFHIALRHDDIDEIHASFQEVLEFLECREGGEYSAANARLMTWLELLSESERLSLKNIL